MQAMTIPPSPKPAGEPYTGRILQAVFSVAILLATLFTAFSPRLFSGDFGQTIRAMMTPQVISEPVAPEAHPEVRIGIVSGHWGDGTDPGAVCGNGVTESGVNYKIAVLVRQKLEQLNYTVDLLQEQDPRLGGYRASALVSIHADTCADLGLEATGYKVAAAVGSRDPNLSARLVACIASHYGTATNLPYHPGSITDDMTGYHAFEEIDPATTAAIIETGFLFLDYPTLSERSGDVAQGIVNGILCYINNDNIEPLPAPPNR